MAMDEPQAPQAPQESKPNQNDSEPMLYCPACSSRLTELKCKLVCERCGYFMSCADYY